MIANYGICGFFLFFSELHVEVASAGSGWWWCRFIGLKSKKENKTEGEIRLLGRDYKAPTSPPHKSIPNQARDR